MPLYRVRTELELAMPLIPVSEALQSILDHFLEETTFKDTEELYAIVAEKLSKIADKNPPWKAKYIYNVLRNGDFASKAMREAIYTLATVSDGLPVEIAQSEPVTVFVVRNNSVKPNSLVYAESKLCAKADCTVWFVPNTPNRIYCFICSPPRY